MGISFRDTVHALAVTLSKTEENFYWLLSFKYFIFLYSGKETRYLIIVAKG